MALVSHFSPIPHLLDAHRRSLTLCATPAMFLATALLLALSPFPASAQMRFAVGPNQAINWDQGPDEAPLNQENGERPPNVVLILADDLGWNDITLNGGIADGTVPTPNIDSIAKQGATFSKGYAACGTCAPSRAAIMSGRYPTRFGYEFTPTPPTCCRWSRM